MKMQTEINILPITIKLSSPKPLLRISDHNQTTIASAQSTMQLKQLFYPNLKLFVWFLPGKLRKVKGNEEHIHTLYLIQLHS